MFLQDSPFDLVNCRKYTLMPLGLHLSDHRVNRDLAREKKPHRE